MLVSVRFDIHQRSLVQDSQEYYFACALKVIPGDYVVCDTRYGYALGRVQRVDVLNAPLPREYKGNYKEVLARVDIENYEVAQARKEAEEIDKQIASLALKRSRLRKTLGEE